MVNKFNVLNDPFINQKLGLSDYLRRVFNGEILSIKDIKVPYGEIENRYKGDMKYLMDYECYQDLISFPLHNENHEVIYVITVFMTKRICLNRLEAIKAKEFIDSHWFDEFDWEVISNHIEIRI